MLKVTTRPVIESNGKQTLPQIDFRADMPNRLKVILKDLYYPVPKIFKDRILKSEHCGQILEYVISWPSLDVFYLKNVKTQRVSMASLLKQLSLISFPNLQQLYLENMKLDNFDFLQFVDCPNLKIIYLFGNHSRTLKSIGKSNWKKLQKIEIRSGLSVEELQYLQRMKMADTGKVVNQVTNEAIINEKKNSATQIDDSLMLIWPKLQGKRYSYLIQARKNSFKRKQ